MTCPHRLFITLAGLLLTIPVGAAELAHMVYFTLAEDTSEHRRTLITSCREHLSGHDGTVYFSVGAIADDLSRDVNDKDFDVALHLVFKDRSAHDKYQTHPRHLKFIAENKHLWSKVRVFDSDLATDVRGIDRFLSSGVELDASQKSLADALTAIVNSYNRQHKDDTPVTIQINGRDLQFEGITQNQRVPGIEPAGKTVAELLTTIVLTANPDKRAEGPDDARQLLVWAVGPDGKSIQVTTRRGAKKAKLSLPKVFQVAKP